MEIEYEQQFRCQHLSYSEMQLYLRKLGFDFTDDKGDPLLITELFCRQVEAVSKGIGGRMPDTSRLGLDTWAAGLERDARKFRQLSRGRSGET